MTEMNPKDIARIARQRNDTPEDSRITGLLKNILTSEWSKNAAQKLRQRITSFYKFSFDNLEDQDKITEEYGKLLPEMSEIVEAKIAEGESFLEQVKNQQGLIVVTNHFGIARMAMIDNSDRSFPVPLNEIVPFPARLAGLPLIAKRLGVNIYECALELPEPLLKIQMACKTITLPNEGTGRTEKLTKSVSSVITKDSGAVIVMYPEGGTSGKRNMGTPYDLDEFHSGAFVVAAKTGLPILPVCQYFNPDNGYELHILEPIFLSEKDITKAEEITEKIKGLMQDKLNSLVAILP